VLWTDLAKAFIGAGKNQEAVQALQVAIGTDGANVEPVLMMAEIARDIGELESYSELCAAAKQIAPADPRVLALG
jgi:Tfp pilus assembly protein PilF